MNNKTVKVKFSISDSFNTKLEELKEENEKREILRRKKIMNNTYKVMGFFITNKIDDEGLLLDFNNNTLTLIYREFEFDIDECEIEITEEDDYSVLTVEDCDGYKISIDTYGGIDVETPDDELEDLKYEYEQLLTENSKLFYKVQMLEELLEEIERLREQKENYTLFLDTKVFAKYIEESLNKGRK